MKLNKKRTTDREAFTLIELLIVLGILVMLAAVVGPRVLKSGQKADIRMTTTHIGGLQEVVKMYYMDMKEFPTTEQGLRALYRRPDDLEENNRWDGPYGEGEEVPRDPWGNEYQYEWPPTHTKRDSPEIWSYGPDGEDETMDDICNWKRKSSSEDGEFDMSELDDLGDSDEMVEEFDMSDAGDGGER